jgi:hypothetical protein
VLRAHEVPVQRLKAGWSRAAAAHQAHELRVTFAGVPVEIRVVGNTWSSIVERALRHLPAPAIDAPAAFTVEVWDVAETGVVPEGLASDPDDPPIVMRTSDDGAFIGEERDHTTLWLDCAAAHLTGFTRSAEYLALDERARPFHKLLSEWLMDRGVQFVHAGLVSCAGRGVLMVGHGGAGKSTSSIACLLDGLGYLGDDFVGLSLDGDSYTGHGFYASCLLDSGHMRRFPQLLPHALPPNRPEEHKHVMYLSQAFPANLESRNTINAIVMPRVTGGPVTGWKRASPIDALRAIAPTSVMYLPRPSRDAFDRLAGLVASVPAYWLELGTNVSTIAPAVRSLVASLDGPQSKRN